MRESVMIMMIIGSAALFSYMMSSLYITQSLAEWIAALDVSPWALLFSVNVFLLIAGLFLPPVAVILMAAPTLVPIVETIGFDPIWFGIIMVLVTITGMMYAIQTRLIKARVIAIVLLVFSSLLTVMMLAGR